MKGNVTYVVLMGSLVSILGTMVGALLGVIVRNPSKRFLSAIFGFCGGLMLSIVAFDLIPEALNESNIIWTILFSVMGILVIAIIDSCFHVEKTNQGFKMAVLTAIGLMIHNFPEGIIMGCGFAAGGTLGIKMSLIIAIHDVPEGLAVASPLMASKVNVFKILLYVFLTALPTTFGSFIGLKVGSISPKVLSGCLAVASGIMLYVVCGEMFPESSRISDGKSGTIGTLVGIFLGLAMVKIF